MRAFGHERIRGQLLSYLPWFVEAAARIAGVRRIGLLGSITTDKQDPKDIDFLVTVEDDADLEPLARLGRKLQGGTQQMNRGADIFLANPQGKYIGRTCHWKDCRPGIRSSCDALHCGRRHYLHDDLNALMLSEDSTRASLELWPEMKLNAALPADLENVLRRLKAEGRP